MEKYCQVAVRLPRGNSVLTYLQKKEVEVGDIVNVPLGSRVVNGCILSINHPKDESQKYKCKEVISVDETGIHLTQEDLKLFSWIAKYYHYSIGSLIFDCLPKFLKRPRPFNVLSGQNKKLTFDMNQQQQDIYEQINSQLSKGFFKNYIHGVTGSGKTIIYLNIMFEIIKKGKSVLFLLPEINLTPQFIQTFEDYLDCPILSYHSGVNNSEKYNVWKYLKETTVPVVVLGVRSSVFLPLRNLGLVIIDEEHDSSFKQTDRCPYNGRDVAIKKAQLSNAAVILGSATPATENYFNYRDVNKQNNYFTIKERAVGSFPDVELIDCRTSEKLQEDYWPLASESIEEIKKSLDKKEQVLILVNRLGFASFVQCYACGHQFTDPNTGVNLRYFKKKNTLVSAYSDYQIPLPDICPKCGNMNLLQKGFGTEKIEEVLRNIFLNHNIDRFDRDEIKNSKQLKEKLSQFQSHQIDILVGTQMLAKGHNFEKVNLVLILGIDSQLNFPDFRSVERAYQLITQVTGRAGRYSSQAKVLIQTLSKENKIFEYVKKHSFNQFYIDELEVRQSLDLPPYSKIAVIYFSSRFRDRVINVINSVTSSLERVKIVNNINLEIQGPTPTFVERKTGQYSWVFMLKTDNMEDLHLMISTFENNYKAISNVSYKIDVDPYFCM